MRRAQFADQFGSFGDEKSVFGAGALVGQLTDELDFGFGHRCFSITNVVPSVAGKAAGKSVRASSTSTPSSLYRDE